MTIFERILAGELPADVVYEDHDVLAFRDTNPQAPVHILVIPKPMPMPMPTDFAGLVDWEDAAVGKLFKKTAQIARDLGLEQDGYRVISNCGAGAGQTVFYLHLHILSGRPFSWPPG